MKKALCRAGAILLACVLTVTSVFGQTTVPTGGGGASGGGGGGSTTTVPSPTPQELTAQINSLLATILALQQQIKEKDLVPVEVVGTELLVTVSDLGQPKEQRVPLGVLAPYTEVSLSVTNSEFLQSVYLTLRKRGFLDDANPDLYLSIGEKTVSWGPFKLSGGQAIVGPIHLSSDRTVRVTVYAKLDATGTVRPNDPPVMAFDVTGISVDGYTTVQKTVGFRGRFPILGATHTIDPTSPVATLQFERSDRVVAQNIVKNMPRQLLGGFKATARIEASTHDLLTFYVDGIGADVGLITNVELVDENDRIVAGPVDVSVGEKADGGYLLFQDTVVFPLGEHHYFFKGKVGSSFGGSAITVSLPSTQSQPARGLTTGNLFFPSETWGWGPTMTVRGASKIKVSVRNAVPSKEIIAGSMHSEGLELIINTAQANGDIGISVFGGITFGTIWGRPTDVHNVRLYDGTTAINNGSNVLNPSVNGIQRITPDTLFRIGRGAEKSLKLKFSTSVAASGYMIWQLTACAAIEAVDLITGERVEVELVPAMGPLINVVQSGAFSIQTSALAPNEAKVGEFVKIGSLDFATSIEGVQGGTLELSIESAGASIGRLGMQIGFVIGEVRLTGILLPKTENMSTVIFNLGGVAIGEHSTIRGDLYADISAMPTGAVLNIRKTRAYMVGQTSGFNIKSQGPEILGIVTIK
ncbi:MAG: hypothetical protein Q7R93_05155 [bacterium]|nr:hypothetical protein [bacterium]